METQETKPKIVVADVKPKRKRPGRKPKPNSTAKSNPNKYRTQNKKIWTVNFSGVKYVNKARLICGAMKKYLDLRSQGLTLLMCLEFVDQEHIRPDFKNFVNQKRKILMIDKS